MRILFLFGAGASKGSESEGKLSPPLSTELFDQLRQQYPRSWGVLDPSSFVVDGDDFDFERGMSNLLQSNPANIPQLQKDMGRFFFQFKPSPNSLYSRLLNELSPHLGAVAFATLNYDLLLERTMLTGGLRPVCGKEGSVDSNEVEVCLPHGCSHLWIDGFRGPSDQFVYDPRSDVFNGSVRAFGSPGEFADQLAHNPLPPVMSCFDFEKISPTGKKFIDGQRRRMAELVGTADLVIVIGVQVREHDKHLWEPLGAAKGKLLYCAGSGAEGFQKWQVRQREQNTDKVFPGYFGDHLEDIVSEVRRA